VDPYSQGVSLLHLKQYSAALPLFEKAVHKKPNASAYYGLGYCQAMLEFWKEADLNLYLSLQRQPNPTTQSYVNRLWARLSGCDQQWVVSRLTFSGPTSISDYVAVNYDCRIRSGGKLVHLFREFKLNGHPRALVIDSQTLQVQLLNPESLRWNPAYSVEMNNSRYGKALEASSKFLGHLEDNGMTHALPGAPEGAFLTADLCPSHHGRLETRFFSQLEKIYSYTQRAVPIGLAVSGVWMEQHGGEFEYLRNLEARGVLRITWINHTYHHPYDPRISDSDAQQFLPMKNARPEDEVLGLEIALLQKGEIPSAYFRFPDLESDAAWMKTIKNLSLITVGSDSWLAKGEEPRSGSIILVHANGNEPTGINRFLSWLPRLKEMGPFLGLSDLFPAFGLKRS
jgi:hypothetical protein